MIVVLTEDGDDAPHKAVTLALWRLAAPGVAPPPFEPPPEVQRKAMRATGWKTKGEAARRLYAYVATQLALGRVVLFHVDGDTRWSQRERSENRAKLDEVARATVRRHLSQGREPIDVDAVMRRFVALVPHWELESWLLHNQRAARALAAGCRRGGEETLRLLEAWAAEPATLDEVAHPSDAVCFGKQGNAELANRWPAPAALAASPSLGEAFAALQAASSA